MITPTDRKIMMLQKMVNRGKKRIADFESSLLAKDATIANQQTKIQLLISRLKGSGAKAPVPDELLACYTYAVEYVTANRYGDRTQFSCFIDPSISRKPYVEAKGKRVIDWDVEKLADGLYDLTFVREWTY